MIQVTALEKKYEKLEKVIHNVLSSLLSLENCENKSVEVYVVGDDFMKRSGEELIEQYKRIKGKDRGSIDGFNVLSFPGDSDFSSPGSAKEHLGEIYINPDYIEKAGEDILFMIIHGFLHLIGYDHEAHDDRIKMAKEEERLYGLLQEFKLKISNNL